jgi:hypothetical protein
VLARTLALLASSIVRGIWAGLRKVASFTFGAKAASGPPKAATANCKAAKFFSKVAMRISKIAKFQPKDAKSVHARTVAVLDFRGQVLLVTSDF